ncbi:LOW QUALITY PROTEIN: D site-binding protein [Ammospiza caudacuta]|uniref:LOW QUALITY PROTEIN: D site-binding protein n=1 Tax=Ammospiza caudacuta TaxID=2857398 RepID=UPI00273A1074|nr:LOW QUALITY PROTEIN: D site-binding protein [Ammospiza caudacuta]
MGGAQRARGGRGLFFERRGLLRELAVIGWWRGGAGPREATPSHGRSAPAGLGPRNRDRTGTEPGQFRNGRAGGSRGGFLGAPPPPWERPPAPIVGGGPDLEYVDLDEFLREHGLPPPAPRPPARSPQPHERAPAPGPPRAPPEAEAEPLGGGSRSRGGFPVLPPGGGPGAGAGGGPLDPRRLRFSQEELRPQPMARKARKVHVPDEQKDEKYWSRRSRNNAAAKRSRDARRLKENQISVRAAFLERENAALRVEVAAARRELQRFRAILARYEAQHGQI